MNTTRTADFGDGIARIAIKAAGIYLSTHELTADKETLSAAISDHLRAKLPEALNDAREAYACGMNEVAQQSFTLSIAQAGIEAAKECGMPAKHA